MPPRATCQPVSATMPIDQSRDFSTTVPPAQQTAAAIIRSGPSGSAAERDEIGADQDGDAQHAEGEGRRAAARSSRSPR